MTVITVTDDKPKSGTRRKRFHYIREGNLLRHISKYALREVKIRDEKSLKVEYEVPIEGVKGKEVYEFDFTNSGSFGISKYNSEELLKGSCKAQNVDIAELKRLEFEIENNKVIMLIEEVLKYYLPIISEINDFKAKLGINYIFASPRVSDYLRDIKWGLASSLCNWPEEKRIRSLKQATKLLHQLWAIIIFHEILGVTKIEENKLIFEQGFSQKRCYPASVFVDAQGNYWTCWYEPQKIEEAPPDYKGPLTPLFEGRVAWKRPDIIISKGKYKRLIDAPKFDILIECKNLPFEEWWNKGKVVGEQLLPYKHLFNPELFIVASLKPVSDWAKDKLEKEGFKIVDNFYPSGEGVIKFEKIIKSYLVEGTAGKA